MKRGGAVCCLAALLFYEALPQRDGDGFRAVRRSDFGEEGNHVLLHHVDADAELVRDVAIGESANERLENLRLALGELRDWRVVGGGALGYGNTFGPGGNGGSGIVIIRYKLRRTAFTVKIR